MVTYLGRRVAKHVAIAGQPDRDYRYVYDGWNLIAEIDGPTGAIIRTHLWGLDPSGGYDATGAAGALLLSTGHTATTLTPHDVATDGAGNITALVTANGSLAAAYEYDPFGQLLRTAGPLARENPFGWSGKFTDRETGLVYYGLRLYDPGLGRWLNRDPIGEAGGPNLYGFVGNNPANFSDTLGANPFRTFWDWLTKPLPADTSGMEDGRSRFVPAGQTLDIDDYDFGDSGSGSSASGYQQTDADRRGGSGSRINPSKVGNRPGSVAPNSGASRDAMALADRERDILFAAQLLSMGISEEDVQASVYLSRIGRDYVRESEAASSTLGKVGVFLKHWLINDPAAQMLAIEAGGAAFGAARARIFRPAAEVRTGPIRSGEVTTYDDFVERSVVGDNLEGHELWQHANLKANGLAGERLSTVVSQKNPVIALERPVHQQVNSAQRAIDAKTQTPMENIKANAKVLRDLNAASESSIARLRRMAEEHAKVYGRGD